MDEMTTFLLGELRERIAEVEKEASLARKRAASRLALRDTLIRMAQLVENGGSPINPEALVRAVGVTTFPAVAEDMRIRLFMDGEEPDEIVYLCDAFGLPYPDKQAFMPDDPSLNGEQA